MPSRNFIIFSIALLVSLACYSVAAKNRYANMFGQALTIIENEALQEVPAKDLFESAMDGMLDKLDVHSAYISGDDFRAFNEDLQQEFGGVGMYVENNPENERLFILAPIPGSPAFEAGLKIGDEIVAIDGDNVERMDSADAVKKMRGPVGKPVEITIQRDGSEITKRLVRQAIPVPSVTGDYRNADSTWSFVLKDYPRIGYIRLKQFGEKSSDEFADAFKSISPKIDGLIIDLRNNSGGLLDVAIDICDYFLEPGQQIVSTRGRGKRLIDSHQALSAPMVRSGLPIVILVNRNSASASEIVAGCLQDQGRVVVIGEQTYGKGTVQNVIHMQHGNSALKLTTASYWRPSGKNIDRHDAESQRTKIWGVQPDPEFVVEMTEKDVFENTKLRSIRELEGLVPDSQSHTLRALKNLNYDDLNGSDTDDETQNVDAENDTDDDTNDESATQGEESGTQADDAEVQSADEDLSEPITPVDRPMQRAIEYFESILNQQWIAA